MLVFFRNGNIGSYGKVINIDLNQSIQGREGINKATCFLKNYEPFYAIYTSPNIIAVKSSEIIKKEFNIPLIITNELKEIDYKNILYDKEYSQYIFCKSISILDKWMTIAEDSNIIVIGHSIFFSTWICHILHNNPFEAWLRSVISYKHPLYIIDKCSISTIHGSKGRYAFGLFNYTDYASSVPKKIPAY